MHELSLMEDVIRIVQTHAGDRTVTAVRLKIGALTCVQPDALRFCFAACKAGTLLQNAVLDIETVPARARCHRCGQTFALDELYQPCPCGSFEKTLLQGQELHVQSLELH